MEKLLLLMLVQEQDMVYLAHLTMDMLKRQVLLLKQMVKLLLEQRHLVLLEETMCIHYKLVYLVLQEAVLEMHLQHLNGKTQ